MALSPFEFDLEASGAVLGGNTADRAMKGPGSVPPPLPKTGVDGLDALPTQRDTLAPANPITAAPKPAREPVVGYNFATKQVYSGGKVFDGTNGTVLDEYAQAGFLDQDNPELPSGFDPVPASQVKARLEKLRTGRSYLDTAGEIAQGVGRGVTSGLPSMVNEAAAYFSPQGSEAEQFFKDNSDYWKNSADPADMLGRGRVAQTTIEAAEQLAPSVAAMGAIAANPLVGIPATATLFGASQAQNTFENVMKATGDLQSAREAAWANFLIEGTGEAVGDWVGAKFLKGGADFLRALVRDGRLSVPQAVKAATNPAIMARYTRAFAGNAAVQSGTEFAQAAGQTAVENNAGVPYRDPIAAGTHGAEVGLAMSALLGPFGIPGAVAQGNQRAALGRAINNPDNPVDMLAASRIVAAEIEPDVGTDASRGWLGAKTRIANAAERKQAIAAWEAANSVQPPVPPSAAPVMQPAPVPLAPDDPLPEEPAQTEFVAPPAPVATAPVAPAAQPGAAVPAMNVDTSVNTGMPVSGPGSLNTDTRSRVVSAMLGESETVKGTVADGVAKALDEVVDLSQRVDRLSSRIPPRDATQNKKGLAAGAGNWAAAFRSIADRLDGTDSVDDLRREFEAVRKSLESSNKRGGRPDEQAVEFDAQLKAIREKLPMRGSLNRLQGVHARDLREAADALDKLVPGKNLTGGDFAEKDTGETLATLQTKLKRSIDNLLKKAQGTTKKDQRARAAIEKLVAEFKARKEALNASLGAELADDEYGDFEYDTAGEAAIAARNTLDRHISMAWSAYKKGLIAEIDETGRHTDRQLSHVRDTRIRKAGTSSTSAADSPLAEAALGLQIIPGGQTFTGVEAVLLYLRRSGTPMEKTLAKLLSTSLKGKQVDIEFVSPERATALGMVPRTGGATRFARGKTSATVYIQTATPEVVLHELMHAASAMWVLQNKNHALVAGLAKQLAYAKNQLDASWTAAEPGTYKRVVADTFRSIESAGSEAHQVAEFIAYAMTRNDFQHFLQQRKGVNMDKLGMGYSDAEKSLMSTARTIYKFFVEIMHKMLGIKGVERVNKGLENTRKFSEYLMTRIIMVTHEAAGQSLVNGRATTLEHRIPPVGKTAGTDLERQLFGGALDNRYAAERGDRIEAARKQYSNIRDMLGLAPVTDWSRLPKDLVQNVPDDDVSFNHTEADTPDGVNDILKQVRSNGHAYTVDAIFAAPFKMLLPGLYGRGGKGIGEVEGKVGKFTTDFLKAHPAAAYWAGKVAEYVGVPKAAKEAIRDVYKLVRGADSALGNRMEDALREIPAEESVRIVEALQYPHKLNALPGEYRAIVKEVHERLLQLRDEAWAVGGLDAALKNATVAEMIQWAKDKSDIASSGFNTKVVGLPKNFRVFASVDDSSDTIIWGSSPVAGTKYYPVYTKLDPTVPDMFIAETERAALASYGADTTMAFTFDKKVGKTLRFVRNSTFAEVQAVRNAIPLTHYLANTIAVMSKVVAGRELTKNILAVNEDADPQDCFVKHGLDALKDANGNTPRVINWGANGENLHHSDREAARRPDVWVKAPPKFGLGADAYVNGSVFGALLDLSSDEQFITSPTYNRAMRMWKGSKTKWSPATHVTNTISNLSMVYLHDIPMRAVRMGARIMAKDMAIKAGRKVTMTAEEETLLRYFNQSGALLGNYSANELNRKLSEAMAEEFDDPGAQPDSIWSKAKTMIRFEQIKAGLIKADTAAGDLYQFEDNMFRFAAFLTEYSRQQERGGKPQRDQILAAGAFAKYALIDYDISAKGINALRQTVLPFLAWPYRAIPMLTRIAYQKPWKMAAMMSAVWAINALGYAATGGDEEEDRKGLDKWMRQKVWGIGPSAYVRMPWGDPDTPVFMGVGKFIPNGDLLQQSDHGFMGMPGWPAFATPTGPLIALLLAGTGWDAFQGRKLWSDSAPFTSNAMASLEYLTNQLAPNLPVVSPRVNEHILGALRGKRDIVGMDLNDMYTVSRLLGSRVYEVNNEAQVVKQGAAIRALVRDYRSQISAAARAEARFGEPDFDKIVEQNKERAEELMRKINELKGEE